MKIKEIGYLGIDSEKMDEWRSFASDYIGFEVRALDGGSLGLRMDEYAWRILVRPAQRNGVGFIGMKVDSAQELQSVRDELKAAGRQVNESTDAERALRGVRHMAWTLDPDGNRVEFFCGRDTDKADFKPGRPIGGFRTGSLGFGHVVLASVDLEPMENFYMRLLGFRLSDYFGPVRFLHINGRHHSLALAGEGVKLLHHIMVEYKYIDDVGRLYDKALTMPGVINTTLGRHGNDDMLSFYSHTPGGFLIETGWGGRTIDSENWEPKELLCMSVWGHVRSGLTPDRQAQRQAQKDIAASMGLVAPVEINDEGGFVRRNTIGR